MSEVKHKNVLPEPKLDEAALEEVRRAYAELIGFVPPRVRARTDLLAKLDPEFLAAQEDIRRRAMYPEAFDVKTTQLMLFGMLLVLMGDAARLHGRAARRAGATYEELNAVVNLAFLFRGMPAANFGAQVVQEIAAAEGEGKL